MSLKQIIRQSRLLNEVVGNEMVLPGEPMIYSVKYPVGQRTRGVQFFRNMKWKSFLKTFFRSFYRTTTPVAVIVRFYVSPPEYIKVPLKLLRQESLPAVMSYELCDYTLSFLEMLHHVLFNSYRQVVKLDVEKIYSNNPRTVMKYMKWDEYVKLQGNNTLHTKAKSVGEDVKRQKLQPKRKGNETGSDLREEQAAEQSDASSEGCITSSGAFCSTSSVKSASKKKRSAKLPASHKEAGRRQPREISQ